MPADYLAMKSKFIHDGLSKESAEAKAARIHNSNHPGEPVGSHSDFSTSNAPLEARNVYDQHRFEKIAAGHDPDKAHKHAIRMLHESGWYRGVGGKWKRMHEDLRNKINVREPIKQPDGRYVIEDVDVFYPNAVKDGEFYDDEAIERIIDNTNRMINDGAQQPALLEGHVSPLEKMLSNQKRPWGYAVNWRKNPAKKGMVRCDLVKVDPEFILKQRARPLTGLSPGIAKDAAGLSQRFDHVAVLGSSLQALSALPRTELSAMYSSNQVCFSADAALNFSGVNSMPGLNNEGKKAMLAMADHVAAYSAAMKSYAADEPHSWEKVNESKSKIASHFAANKSLFEAMPDEPLVKHAMESVKGRPGKGPGVIKDEMGEEAAKEPDKDSDFDAEADTAFAAEQQAQNRRIAELESQLSQAVKTLNLRNFEAEIEKLTSEGTVLPPLENITAMYNVCYSSEDPVAAIDDLLAMYKAMPKQATAARVGTVLGAAGATAVAGAAANGKQVLQRSLYEKALGSNFSSDAIEGGRKFGEAFLAEMAKRQK